MISILGCGWYGLALGKALVKDGLTVKGSTTSPNRVAEINEAGLQPYIVALTAGTANFDADFFNCETLIVSIPPKLRSGETDYIPKTQNLIEAILKYNVKQVIYISSTGVYPESNSVVDEQTIPEPNTESGRILFAAENLFTSQTAFQTTVIRFGGLVGPGRHPGRFFAGKQNIPNGKAPVNLIHQQDCIGLTKTILNKNAFGYTFNACSPDHPAKAVYYSDAASHAGLALPQFVDELQEWKTINSVSIPANLNYSFAIDDWKNCFVNNCF